MRSSQARAARRSSAPSIDERPKTAAVMPCQRCEQVAEDRLRDRQQSSRAQTLQATEQHKLRRLRRAAKTGAQHKDDAAEQEDRLRGRLLICDVARR